MVWMGRGKAKAHPSGVCWCRCRGRRGGNRRYYRGILQYRFLRCEARHRIRRPVEPSCVVISDEPATAAHLDSPERGPEPISLRHLRNDLHLPVPDRLRPFGVEARRTHGGDGVSERVVAVDHAVEGGVFRVSASAVGGEVDGVAVRDLLVSDGGGLVGEGGDDVEALGIDERVLGVRRRPVEGAGAEAVDLDLVVPYALVKGREGVVED